MSAVDTSTLAGAFATTFGGKPDGLFTAPGRVNLIGEHTDYTGGFVLPFAIDAATTAAIALNDSGTLRLASRSQDGVVEVDLVTLAPGAVDGWAAYPAGVVWALGERGVRVEGADILVDSTVPTGSGLSSSAALECSVAVGLCDLTGASLGLDELVLACQRAENEMAGAPTGIMDQTASLRGAGGHAVFLDTRDQHSELVPLPLAEEGLVLLVIDTRVVHDHATGGYADRRRSTELARETLGVEALRDVTVADLEDAQHRLDPVTFRRLRHVVTENQRVLETVATLRSSSPAAIGHLLDASHASMRDDFAISCAELDTAVDAARSAGAIGARMTGGGFGGSAIALVRGADVDAVTAAVHRAFADAGYTAPDVFAVEPADGAHRVG
ncbi:galactokinase [Tersicoccus solisilvae]|uniref:Galactokinase n=1 Tax=Tersicoccus solisilvae TaxID=1882339 RepID=A0ABQ1P8Y1_9MICC|nr:galactokinase [Tersicoccus solisilvae]GGC92402.1 galactokinase [Tersicoccus solisilvae]